MLDSDDKALPENVTIELVPAPSALPDTKNYPTHLRHEGRGRRSCYPGPSSIYSMLSISSWKYGTAFQFAATMLWKTRSRFSVSNLESYTMAKTLSLADAAATPCMCARRNLRREDWDQALLV
jgi:hypothetical protein